MQTIIKLSITLKLKILRSVLLTVLKLRFSLVLKYFWLRVMVESWPESLNMDSSRAEVCSGDVPCFEGIAARCSCSTCQRIWLAWVREMGEGRTHGNFKIDKFLCKCAHLIVKAESVFAHIRCCEDEVSLSLLLSIHNNLVLWAYNLIIDIKRTSCLDLWIPINYRSINTNHFRGYWGGDCLQRSKTQPSHPYSRPMSRSMLDRWQQVYMWAR